MLEVQTFEAVEKSGEKNPIDAKNQDRKKPNITVLPGENHDPAALKKMRKT